MKDNQASKENRKEKKHKNGPILVEMNFTMQMKVGNCSLDQNPTLLWSAPKKNREYCFVENGHLCKSDLSPCSAPMCTYEKVH